MMMPPLKPSPPRRHNSRVPARPVSSSHSVVHSGSEGVFDVEAHGHHAPPPDTPSPSAHPLGTHYHVTLRCLVTVSITSNRSSIFLSFSLHFDIFLTIYMPSKPHSEDFLYVTLNGAEQ